MNLVKKLFWSEYLSWLRKKLGVVQVVFPPIEEVLEATGGPQKPPKGHYTSCAGCDVKVFFEMKDGTEVCVPEIQAMSVERQKDGFTRGTIISLLFDKDTVSELAENMENILLKAANEYGLLCTMRLEGCTLTKSVWAGSIDDIVMEIVHEFQATDSTPWVGNEHSKKLAEMEMEE